MIKFFLPVLIALGLAGCAANYTLDGKLYENETKFQQAIDQMTASSIDQVIPLNKPLTTKRLIVAFPSENTIYNENIRRHTATKGMTPIGLAIEQYRNLSLGAYKQATAQFNAIKKRGIYSDVTITDTQSMVNSLEPSNQYDVLYFTEASVGSGQYFYSSNKQGKQVFAYDKSGTTPTAKVNSFIEAIQALAIRD